MGRSRLEITDPIGQDPATKLTFPRLFAAIVTIVVQVVRALSRSRADLILENLALRQQMTTSKRKRPWRTP